MDTFENPNSENSKAWCRNHFDAIKEGGVWAVPRSGLIFRKEGNKLVCITRMSHHPKMPLSAAELLRYQDGDIATNREHFAAVGVVVEDQSNLPNIVIDHDAAETISDGQKKKTVP